MQVGDQQVEQRADLELGRAVDDPIIAIGRRAAPIQVFTQLRTFRFRLPAARSAA